MGPHGKEGWLNGPAMHHYRHFEVAVSETGGGRVSDTIEFLPTKCNMPKTSSEDRIIAVLEEISSAVKQPQVRSQFLIGDATNNIIQELTKIFQTDAALPRVPVTPKGNTAVSPRVTKDYQSMAQLQGCQSKNQLFPTNWE